MDSIRCLLAVVLAAVAATIGLVANAGPATACSCLSASPARSAQWADAVFTGELIRSAAADGELAYTFAVERVYRGAVGPVTEVRSMPACGLERMETGRRYVVFAGMFERVLTSGLCSGTAPAHAAYVDQVEQRLGPGSAPLDAGVPADGGSGGSGDDGGSADAGGKDHADDGDRTLLAVAGTSAAVIILALVVGAVRSGRQA